MVFLYNVVTGGGGRSGVSLTYCSKKRRGEGQSCVFYIL